MPWQLEGFTLKLSARANSGYANVYKQAYGEKWIAEIGRLATYLWLGAYTKPEYAALAVARYRARATQPAVPAVQKATKPQLEEAEAHEEEEEPEPEAKADEMLLQRKRKRKRKQPPPLGRLDPPELVPELEADPLLLDGCRVRLLWPQTTAGGVKLRQRTGVVRFRPSQPAGGKPYVVQVERSL